VSEDLISRYKKSFRINFRDANTEAKYRDMQKQGGQGASVLAFGVLFVLCLTFAYIELDARGIEMAMPMYGYLLAALLAMVNLFVSRFSTESGHQQLRLVTNGLLAMGTVIGAVFLQKYNPYHVIEFVLLVVWLGSLKTVRMLSTLVLNVLLACTFVVVMQIKDASGFQMLWVSLLLAVAVMLAAYLGYLAERARRMLFLQIEANSSMNSRQELWSFTLIDLDLALSGILDFRTLIALLKKNLEPVIDFDSYVLTSLEGQGPKPVPDQIEGELFENDDATLWSEELLGKLTQTRQASVSAEHEMVKGLLGREKRRFVSYRLDIPIFNDSRLVGIISLRRAAEPFDRLDMIASVSIAAQAMLIFKRSARIQQPPLSKPRQDSVIRPNPNIDTAGPISNADDKDMEMTDHSFTESDQTLAPQDVVTKFKREQAASKKTITLMSRDNADKVAVDRYRTAVVEGEPLSVMIVEVDGLSKLREQDGDEVAYKVFAAIVKYIFSKIDKEKEILGRYGQNGLSVLMPKVDMNAAERFAEMIRQFVSTARYKTAYGEKTATLSIGVAALTDDTGDYASMVKRADMALFVAKKNGRNCVKVRL
jgi:diguanylate cyclase (GGDEF)-like protein